MSADGPVTKKLKISKVNGIFGSKIEVDASDFYNKKILTLKQKIKEEEKAQKMENAGICVIVFRSREISTRFRSQEYLIEKLKCVKSLE